MRNTTIITIFCLLAIACKGKDNPDTPIPTPTPEPEPEIVTDTNAPTNLVLTQLSSTSISLEWEDNSASEQGYTIWFSGNRVDSLAANTTSYTYTLESGFATGVTYFFGVKAAFESGESEMLDASIKATPIIKIEESMANDVCFAVRYSVDNHTKSGLEFGLCWSADGEASIDSKHEKGPAKNFRRGDSVFQVIPNSSLEYGKEYSVKPYATYNSITYYGEELKLKLGTEPSAIKLSWNKVTTYSLPSSIELYETTSKLNGDAFHAWYAIADLSAGDITLKVNAPTSLATIDDQAAADANCILLTNAGYFWNNDIVGYAVSDGTVSGWGVSAYTMSSSTSDSDYGSSYYATRGAFGVDSNGTPQAYWVASLNGSPIYYADPLASVRGEALYAAPSAVLPSTKVDWSPLNAVSAGPMLVYDGKVGFNFDTKSSDGFMLSNYEMLASDIFGASSNTADRTAIGYTEDGKIILFICDGRISDSQGCSVYEEAQIMKGLGCVKAVNLDGGGSTGMWVKGSHINDLTGGNRKVHTTIGFYSK